MITRIGANRNGRVIFISSQFRDQGKQFAPFPFRESVFVTIGRPRRVISDETDAGECGLQKRERMLFADQGDVIPFDGLREDRSCEGEIAEAPEFEDEQFRFA